MWEASSCTKIARVSQVGVGMRGLKRKRIFHFAFCAMYWIDKKCFDFFLSFFILSNFFIFKRMINPILIKINDFPFAGSEEEEEKLIDCVYGHRGWRLIKKGWVVLKFYPWIGN